MNATIIGAGNLGGAIACGLARGTFLNAEDITCVDTRPEALKTLAATGLPFVLTKDVRKAVKGADMLVLAVKSHAAKQCIAEFRDLIDYNKQILFSVVAGVDFEELCSYMFDGVKSPARPILFRVMPNLAISLNDSMTFISVYNANAAQTKLAEAIFSEMGQTMVVPERLLPAAMAVGSCGIAYVMRYVRAMMNGAAEAGFSSSEAYGIILQTLKGAVRLLLEEGGHPEVEIDKVITPGGFTIRGLNAMEEAGFSNSIVIGIRESYKNSK